MLDMSGGLSNEDFLQDAFAYNVSVQYLPYRYASMCLMQSEILRRANLYRPRIYVVPDVQDSSIAAYDTLQYQISLTPGSYLWGILWSQASSTNLLFKLTDICTGLCLFHDYAYTNGYSNQWISGELRPPPSWPTLLNQPRLILAPGNVAVEISNPTSSAVTGQLLLFSAEPCIVVKETQPTGVYGDAYGVGGRQA